MCVYEELMTTDPAFTWYQRAIATACVYISICFHKARLRICLVSCLILDIAKKVDDSKNVLAILLLWLFLCPHLVLHNDDELRFNELNIRYRGCQKGAFVQIKMHKHLQKCAAKVCKRLRTFPLESVAFEGNDRRLVNTAVPGKVPVGYIAFQYSCTVHECI